MDIESMISRPPIVGVPCLTVWCCGPSSRIGWPNSLRRRNSMNFGPARIEMMSARIPAIRTRTTARQSPREGLGDALEPERARGLDEDGVAGPQSTADDLDRGVCGRRPSDVWRNVRDQVLPRQLADGDELA